MPSRGNTPSRHPVRTGVSRRGFLDLAGKTLLGISAWLGLAGLGRFLSFQPDPPPPTRFDLGPASSYPPGSRTLIAEAYTVLLAAESGYQALSLVCPHLGCILEYDQDLYACPCHGSRFAADGSLSNGPANQSMRVLKVEITADQRLVLDTSA